MMAKHHHRIGCTSIQLADALNTNTTILKHIFREFIGALPYTFLHNKCMVRAAEIILEGLYIFKVASLSGYSTRGHFSNAFKKTFGMPPTLYSKLIDANNIETESIKKTVLQNRASSGIISIIIPDYDKDISDNVNLSALS